MLIVKCLTTRTIYFLQPCYHCKYRYYSQQKSGKTYYEVIKLPSSASADEIKTAFYSRSKQLHPDKLDPGDHDIDEFLQLKDAYEVLGNKKTRDLYDIYLGAPDSSSKTFEEWRKYSTNIHQRNMHPGSDFNQTDEIFRGMKIETGRDDSWSDFSYFDWALMLSAAAFIVYVVQREYKRSKERKTTKRMRVIDLNESRYINKSSKVPVPVFTNQDNGEENIENIKLEQEVVKIHNTVLNEKPLANELKKTNNDIFDEIKSKGTVTNAAWEEIIDDDGNDKDTSGKYKWIEIKSWQEL